MKSHVKRKTRKKGSLQRHLRGCGCLGFGVAPKKEIESLPNAHQLQLTASEYLRHLGLNLAIEARNRILPKEVLLFCADFNHVGSNLNQIAKKRNGIDPLSSFDRAELLSLKEQLTDLVVRIKNTSDDRENNYRQFILRLSVIALKTKKV